MNALHFGRLQDKLRQLFAVAVVVTHDDVIDDFAQRGDAPVFLDGLLCQLCQFGFNDTNIQFFAGRGALQRLLTAAAVIHIVFTKQR
jgi:hypothetical protein